MKLTLIACALSLSALAGCATPPTAKSLAGLPIVEYPGKPAGGTEFVYKLPAGKPIDMRIHADGSALAGPAEHTLSARLARDLYLYKRWASEDGHTWHDARDLIAVEFALTLPSHEFPGAGDMHLSVNRKAVP